MKVTRAFRPKGRARRTEETLEVPRIAKLMALAICFDQLIKNGAVTDQADLARLGHVTRARLSQIMDLNNLAPQIQAELISEGCNVVSERQLRPITAVRDWRTQLDMWNTFRLEGQRRSENETAVQPA